MEKLKILFLCTGNSCRSQMAEGFTRYFKSDIIDAFSAGIETHGLNSDAVLAMAEAGVDISGYQSKTLDRFKNHTFDYVITVCSHAHETCPWFPGGSKVIHVPFDDPPRLAAQWSTPEEKHNCYRKVRDEIKMFVLELPENLS